MLKKIVLLQFLCMPFLHCSSGVTLVVPAHVKKLITQLNTLEKINENSDYTAQDTNGQTVVHYLVQEIANDIDKIKITRRNLIDANFNNQSSVKKEIDSLDSEYEKIRSNIKKNISLLNKLSDHFAQVANVRNNLGQTPFDIIFQKSHIRIAGSIQNFKSLLPKNNQPSKPCSVTYKPSSSSCSLTRRDYDLASRIALLAMPKLHKAEPAIARPMQFSLQSNHKEQTTLSVTTCADALICVPPKKNRGLLISATFDDQHPDTTKKNNHIPFPEGFLVKTKISVNQL